MRYYMHDGPAAFRFELAGDMEAEDAARLAQDWHTASSVAGVGTLIVDLSFVTSIDEAGRDLFRRWHAAGAQFVASSKRARELVEWITGRPFTRGQANAPTYRPWYSAKSLRKILPVVTKGA
jgi:hypothetical protein